jgi:probable addiction module antidote protein
MRDGQAWRRMGMDSAPDRWGRGLAAASRARPGSVLVANRSQRTGRAATSASDSQLRFLAALSGGKANRALSGRRPALGRCGGEAQRATRTQTRTAPSDGAAFLETPEQMAVYLQACLPEAGGAAAVVAKAWGESGRARAWAKITPVAGLSRARLDAALSADRHPRIDILLPVEILLKVISALGLKWSASAEESAAQTAPRPVFAPALSELAAAPMRGSQSPLAPDSNAPSPAAARAYLTRAGLRVCSPPPLNPARRRPGREHAR